MMAKPVPAKWARDGVARNIIANTLGYSGPLAPEAYGALLLALRDGDVQARVTYSNLDNSLSERYELIAPKHWESNADGEAIHTPWGHDWDGYVEIDIESVFRWLNGRKKAHRPRGTGHKKRDAALVVEARRLRDEGYTRTAAVWVVIGRDGKRAAGHGTPESKHRRILNQL
jgi:hypothetical protein